MNSKLKMRYEQWLERETANGFQNHFKIKYVDKYFVFYPMTDRAKEYFESNMMYMSWQMWDQDGLMTPPLEANDVLENIKDEFGMKVGAK